MTDVPLMTVDTSGLTGTVTDAAVAVALIAGGQGVNIPASRADLDAPTWTPAARR